MRNFEKELEEELDKALTPTLKDEETPDLSRFDKALNNNKKFKTKINYIRRISFSCALILLISLSCLIPLWARDKNSTPPEVIRYYGDNNTIQVEVSEEFIRSYINENIPNYSFIFEECSISNIWGIYDKETSKELLALKFIATKTTGLPTSIDLNIVLNKNYTYSKHSYYTDTTNIESIENKTIYTKESNDVNYKLFVLIERPSCNTYLLLNINDEEILNKFKEN